MAMLLDLDSFAVSMSSGEPPIVTALVPPTKAGAKTVAKSKTVVKASAAGAGTQAKAKKPARKKKPPANKPASAATTQSILNSARAAQVDLAKQKAQAAARRSDPLWYRIEDVLPVVREANAMTSSSTILSEQVQVVEAALGIHGLTRADVTPQAMACLLEQARRFAHELISNAQDYAYSASRAEVSRADLLLAAEMRADYSIAISAQLPKLNLVAQQVNRAPLPPIPSHCYSGVLLPPKQHQLTARTYDIVSGAQVSQKMVRAVPEAPHPKKVSNPSTAQPSYGATRGRPIPVKLKENPLPQTATPMDVSPSSGARATGQNPESMPAAQQLSTLAVPGGTSVPISSTDAMVYDATGGPQST
jgi:hypothetical protein